MPFHCLICHEVRHLWRNCKDPSKGLSRQQKLWFKKEKRLESFARLREDDLEVAVPDKSSREATIKNVENT